MSPKPVSVKKHISPRALGSKGGRSRRHGKTTLGRRPVFSVRDGEQMIDYANAILRNEAPDVPPVRDPGRAALVIGLREAQCRDEDVTLDYSVYENRWQILEEGQASSVPEDLLPFDIIATATKVISYPFGRPQEIQKVYGELKSMFAGQGLIWSDPPMGVKIETHRRLCRVVSRLQGEFSTKMLQEAFEAAYPNPRNVCSPISCTHCQIWLRRMCGTGHIAKIGRGPATRYRLVRP